MSKQRVIPDRYSRRSGGLGMQVHVIVSRRGQHYSQISPRAARFFAGLAVFVVLLTASAGAARAVAAGSASKTVSYRGLTMRVPASWPVYRLTARSTVCVRFNRHAVYLGSPGSRQRCPANAIGRTEAILARPAAAARAQAGLSAGAVTISRLGVRVTATWNRHPGVVRRALGVTPRAIANAAGTRFASIRAGALAFASEAQAGASLAPAVTGTVYKGLGVDACEAPSRSQMEAWGASPYRAIGVYIGGINAGCPDQPNLTASWVAQQWAAGWHLIPTYVGLQAPHACGCTAISTNGATARTEGTQAATDAVTDAQAIGIGPGNPIYDDMEGYTPSTTVSAAVLAFISGWTTELHAEGYGAGVYSSADSGIVDLVSQYGTTYQEPDDIWIARWNGARNTADPNVPSGDWPAGQRLHQYAGDNNETFGGVTLDVDNNYLNGATAFGVAGPVPPPSLRVSPASDGTIKLAASWPGGTPVSSWRALGGTSQTVLAPFGQARSTGSTTTISGHSAFPYYAVEALDSGGDVLATSATVATKPHLALYGHSIFAPARGLIGVPTGCFTGATCHVALTVKAGRTVIATTGRERLATTAGLVHFKLTSAARSMLSVARGHRLAVTVVARDASNTSATATMKLIPFTTSGAAPRRLPASTSTVRLLGARDFVYRRAVGGILASCSGPAPCSVKTKITAGARTIATAGSELIGANEARYLSFKLSPAGRSLLAGAVGNQLPVRVALTNAGTTTQGAIVLTSFS